MTSPDNRGGEAVRPVRRGFLRRRPVVSILPLVGTIGTSGGLRSSFSYRDSVERIERAFGTRGVVAVALAVNSPGGSPVQSTLIVNRIRALSAEKNIPVVTFAEDVAASGGYMLALAGDEIFADASSIIGSIGVISAGFGFTGLMERLGVERRLLTAGDRKAILDPFSPLNADDVARVKAIQVDIHETFKSMVRERRAGKLTAPEDQLFNGNVWSALEARKLGLVDAIGDLGTVMRERYGKRVRFRLMAERRPWLKRRFGLASSDGGGREGTRGLAMLAEDLLAVMEARALWARYGL
jgi:signal peptide peptidase SppA